MSKRLHNKLYYTNYRYDSLFFFLIHDSVYNCNNQNYNKLHSHKKQQQVVQRRRIRNAIHNHGKYLNPKKEIYLFSVRIVKNLSLIFLLYSPSSNTELLKQKKFIQVRECYMLCNILNWYDMTRKSYIRRLLTLYCINDYAKSMLSKYDAISEIKDKFDINVRDCIHSCASEPFYYEPTYTIML